MTPEQYHNIEVVIDRFDFDRVHKFMVLTEWKWVKENGFGVPDVTELRTRAGDLLTNTADNGLDHGYSSTGGLVARKINERFFELDFVLVSSDNDFEIYAEDIDKEIEEAIAGKELKQEELKELISLTKTSNRPRTPFEDIEI